MNAYHAEIKKLQDVIENGCSMNNKDCICRYAKECVYCDPAFEAECRLAEIKKKSEDVYSAGIKFVKMVDSQKMKPEEAMKLIAEEVALWI